MHVKCKPFHCLTVKCKISLFPDRKVPITWMRIIFSNFAINEVGHCQVNFSVTIIVIVHVIENQRGIPKCTIKEKEKK